jgi:hypothetical protein
VFREVSGHTFGSAPTGVVYADAKGTMQARPAVNRLKSEKSDIMTVVLEGISERSVWW